jgi:predicted hotdog family 3-hydroxylacyl-ACP dehydratase
MPSCPWSLAELLPHAAPMLLLDSVLGCDRDSVTVGLEVRADDRFFRPGRGVPPHIGIEWMAQACGVYSGLRARTEGRPVGLGLLLGTRRYQAASSWWQAGERIEVTAMLAYEDDGMGVFDCRILSADGTERASARLTTYQPEDLAAVLGHSVPR